MKELNGVARSALVRNGAGGHGDSERQSDDYYATDPVAIEKLLTVESLYNQIWECACGAGHLSEALKTCGYKVYSTDIRDRGYDSFNGVLDFLSVHKAPFEGDFDILTNPPYKYAKEFVEHALDIVDDGRKVAMFLKLTFLESKSRRALFEKHPPKKIWVFSERVQCAKNGDFETYKQGVGTAVAYAWFIWEKGYTGQTTLGWI